MYQIIERLIMKSPFLMGLIALIVIFIYLKFIFSLFTNWKDADKKTRRYRLIFILFSPFGLWFIIFLNSSSLAFFDNELPSRTYTEDFYRVEDYLDSAKNYIDSINKNNSATQVRFYDSIENKIKREKENKIKDIQQNYKDSVEYLILETAKSNEVRDAFDALYLHTLYLSHGNIKKAQKSLKEVLSRELSDIRLLDVYLENFVAVKDSLGAWKIVSKNSM